MANNLNIGVVDIVMEDETGTMRNCVHVYGYVLAFPL